MPEEDFEPLVRPRAPRIEFDTAVDRIMAEHDETDPRTAAQMLIDNETLGVAAFLVRWILDEETGAAPSLYERAKQDYERWREMCSLAEKANVDPREVPMKGGAGVGP